MKRLIQLCLVVCSSCLLLAPLGQAQTYPDKPVRIVVPFPPGGNVDISARIVAQALSEDLGQPFVVENRPGASGLTGSHSVVKSKPDGYTLLVASNSAISIAPLLNPNAPYEPLRDFTLVSTLAETPIVIEVNPGVPVRSVAELIAAAKREPGKITVATPSSGSLNHMFAELFHSATGARFNLVHYKGNAPAVNDLVGGHVQAAFDQVTSSLAHIRSGKLRALAVSSAARTPELPDVPTLAEEGYPGLETSTFTAMVGPQGMPADVVARLNAALNKALQSSAVKERFAAAGAQVRGRTPEGFLQFLRNEQARWRRVIADANIKSE